MRIVGVVLLACAVAFVAACGGGDDGGDIPAAVTEASLEVPAQPGGGTLDKAALVEAADANCGYQDEALGRMGPIGKTVPGISAQWTGTVPVLQQVYDLQEGLTADRPQAEAWEAYLKASRDYIAAAEQIAAVETEAELVPAYGKRARALSATYPPADELGLKVCSFSPEPTVVETEISDPADPALPQPGNTVEQAASALIKAVETGDCDKVNSQANSDLGELTQENCDYLFGQYGSTELAGTESYGPVAVAEYFNADDGRNGTLRFVIDSDDVLRYAGDGSVLGGGIKPPNEGFDSQANMDQALDAIRDQDGQAFLDLQGPDTTITEAPDPFDAIGSEPGGEVIAADIRENPDAKAVMIGANQLNGYYVFDAGERTYLLENTHSPGSETEYANFGYWLLPGS